MASEDGAMPNQCVTEVLVKMEFTQTPQKKKSGDNPPSSACSTTPIVTISDADDLFFEKTLYELDVDESVEKSRPAKRLRIAEPFPQPAVSTGWLLPLRLQRQNAQFCE